MGLDRPLWGLLVEFWGSAELVLGPTKPVLGPPTEPVLRPDRAIFGADRAAFGACREALEALGIPCYLGGAARGLLPPESPLLLRQNRRDALREADLVLLAGGYRGWGRDGDTPQ